MQPNSYPRILPSEIHKNCGKFTIVGKILAYNSNQMKIILQTSPEATNNTNVEVVFKNIDDSSLFKKGSVMQLRGFGIDNKKMTCSSYTFFQGNLDLNMYYQTVKLMEGQYSRLFSG